MSADGDFVRTARRLAEDLLKLCDDIDADPGDIETAFQSAAGKVAEANNERWSYLMGTPITRDPDWDAGRDDWQMPGERP